MSEFTIRNKKAQPILTLRPPVLAALLGARPESSSLALAKHCQDYKRLTGKELHIDSAQELALLERYGADANGSWARPYGELGAPWHEVEHAFVTGFMARSTSTGILADLRVIEAFYELLDARPGTRAAPGCSAVPSGREPR